ncbi:MAG: HD domain-containing protein [Desulfovibrionaceae bacterium]|jgi:putative hydrolase of HD superfamily|nr:HD domain-containing protein [Desulfovibrionaceae bacterium]
MSVSSSIPVSGQKDGECPNERLNGQLEFLLALDRLKGVERRNPVLGGARRENSAEHSWHAALLALFLAEHAAGPVDVCRVVQMLLLHDVIEIDAGDTFCYDVAANRDKAERELAAADRIFGLLAADQGGELRALWEEFEHGDTPESRLANSLDRFQPLLMNFNAEGGTWREYDLARSQVEARMAPIREGAPGLWPIVERVLDAACERGYLRRD